MSRGRGPGTGNPPNLTARHRVFKKAASLKPNRFDLRRNRPGEQKILVQTHSETGYKYPISQIYGRALHLLQSRISQCRILSMSGTRRFIGLVGSAAVFARCFAAEPSANFSDAVRPTLTHYCYTCHSSQVKAAGLDLEAYVRRATIDQDRGEWEAVLKKLKSGEMPPKGLPRPKPAELQRMTRWFENELDRAPTAQGRV